MRRYYKSLLIFAAIAALALFWPPAALAVAAMVWAFGEDVLVWLYTRFRPVEPRRVAVGEEFPAAYDPVHKLYHWVWKAEPAYSLIGIEAERAIYELYHGLSLKRGEWISYIVIGPDKYIRFTSRVYDLQRAREVERALSKYYVLTPMKAWVGTGRPVSKAVYLTALWPLLVYWSWFALFAVAAWLYVVRKFAKSYVEPALAFDYKITAEALTLNRESLEAVAEGDAAAVAMQRAWAVAFTDRPPVEITKQFKKIYEGRDTGKRIVGLTMYSAYLDRLFHFGERPVALYGFGTAEVFSLSMTRDYLASAEFWLLKEPARALTGDLARFPIMYGGKLLGKSREVQLAVDEFGRPVVVPIDSLPTVHGIIVGASGMGKSWTVGTWMSKLADAGVRIVAVDPHGDYLLWAQRRGAQVFKIPYEVPDDFDQVLEKSAWYKKLVEATGVRDFKTNGVEPKKKRLGDGHVVFDVQALATDSAAQAFWLSLVLVYLVTKFLKDRSERLNTLIIFDEARILSEYAKAAEALMNMLRDLAFGGRKYGFAVWLVAQLESQLPDDIVDSAAIQLILGGGLSYVNRVVRRFALSPDDERFLLLARTPYESSLLTGEPMAHGILRLAPRAVYYRVYIPLDLSLKRP